MPSVELKFVPVGYVNPKSITGKTQRFSHLSPLSFASRESQGKFFVVFSITGQGGNQLSFEIFNQDDTLVYSGKRFFDQAGLGTIKDRVDISTGIFHKAGEVLDTIEFEPGIATRMIHGKAVVVLNNTEVSNIVTFSMERTPTIGTGFKRGQAYQAPITEPAVVTITEPPVPEISSIPEVYAEEEFKTKWYMVTFPSGKMEERKVSQKFINTMSVRGWKFELIDKPPEPVNLDKVTTDMIKQELLNFTIVNNRVQGSIKFTTTDLFNPYYYNKPLTNYLQLKSNDKSIHIKSNKLIFFPPKVGIDYTEHVISFNEDTYGLNIINMESYVRNYADLDMSSVLEFTIEVDKEPTVKPTLTPGKGLMGAGVLGLIGILMLGGFIADHVRRRK